MVPISLLFFAVQFRMHNSRYFQLLEINAPMAVAGKQTVAEFVSWRWAREKIGDREASRGGGCPHYMKNLIQIKEVNLNFE